MCLTGSVLMSLGDQLSGHVFSRRTRSTSSLCTLMGCLGLSYTETPSQGNPRDSLGSQLTEGQSWKGLYWPGPQQLLQPPSALVSGGFCTRQELLAPPCAGSCTRSQMGTKGMIPQQGRGSCRYKGGVAQVRKSKFHATGDQGTLSQPSG